VKCGRALQRHRAMPHRSGACSWLLVAASWFVVAGELIALRHFNQEPATSNQHHFSLIRTSARIHGWMQH
jgi:hypothetical protein